MSNQLDDTILVVIDNQYNDELTPEEQLILDELIAIPSTITTSSTSATASSTSTTSATTSSTSPSTSSMSTIARAVRNIGRSLAELSESNDDDSRLEPGWLTRNQINYDAISESNAIYKKFFD